MDYFLTTAKDAFGASENEMRTSSGLAFFMKVLALFDSPISNRDSRSQEAMVQNAEYY